MICTEQCLSGQAHNGSQCVSPAASADCDAYFIALDRDECMDELANGVYSADGVTATPVRRDALLSENVCIANNTKLVPVSDCTEYVFDQYLCGETCPPGFYGEDGVCASQCRHSETVSSIWLCGGCLTDPENSCFSQADGACQSQSYYK